MSFGRPHYLVMVGLALPCVDLMESLTPGENTSFSVHYVSLNRLT